MGNRVGKIGAAKTSGLTRLPNDWRAAGPTATEPHFGEIRNCSAARWKRSL